ncbi:MAG: MMPL family transporter [Candidatus Faecivicinus sp.]|nr:MMPL family transporter [Candidatus Faecivicinus sp.]
MRFSKAVVKWRVPIVIIAILLMIPATIGMINTRINYDMLDYLPDTMDTVIGQNELMEDFGKGAFSMLVIEGMPEKEVAGLKEKIEAVEHVDSVIWYDSILDLSVPMQLLPSKLYNEFNTGDATMMAVFFDSATSADVTMDAIREIRAIAGKQVFVSGMSALVTDLKDLCEKEEPIYVAIAVVLACLAMMLLLDGWLVPFVFLASIGVAILINLGTNGFLGQISYITKALSAVLQLAVTMDYSIFLWHSYNEQRERLSDPKEAMANAIHLTLTSVIGSSLTTVAGFIALCFMTFTLGKDLGIVMAKGVVLGVISCVTVLPALILIFDKPLQKTKHKCIIPNMHPLARKLTKVFPIFLIVFVLLVPPAYYGYDKTNDEVYYDMGECLPQDIEYVIANTRLREEFDIASTHMLLVDANTSSRDVHSMIREMEAVEGVKYVLGLESIVDSSIPESMIPESITKILKSDRWELLLINSEYKVASDLVNDQIDQLNAILKKYDPTGMLIGEAPCMKDMIETTGHDFQVVNAVSILAIFVIILIVEKSLSLPFILISVIELAIFINLGLPHYFGQSLPFIAPICISTIQLGATVDYAILMTTRYKAERVAGKSKRDAVSTALGASIPSILVSGMGLFAATFGVAVYSDIDIISSMCSLMARGAIISMLCVILILPALLMLCDGLIRHTTLGMKVKKEEN